MIIVLIENYNHISQSFYNTIIYNLQLHQIKCSCGQSGSLIFHAYYERKVKLPETILFLRIARVKCTCCGRTHAILLSSIVPYSQIMLADQTRIIVDYENDTNPNSICDDNPSIDENDVKSVIHGYRFHWKQKLLSLNISFTPLAGLVCSCFSGYSAQFMQIHRGINILFQTPT